MVDANAGVDIFARRQRIIGSFILDILSSPEEGHHAFNFRQNDNGDSRNRI
jgi:hypothetical protein